MGTFCCLANNGSLVDFKLICHLLNTERKEAADERCSHLYEDVDDN